MLVRKTASQNYSTLTHSAIALARVALVGVWSVATRRQVVVNVSLETRHFDWWKHLNAD